VNAPLNRPRAAAQVLPDKRVLALAAVPGLVFGFSLSHIGFGDFAEVHHMFIFSDLRLFLTFCGGVAFTALGVFWYRRTHALAPRTLHAGTVAGSVLFGAGWAVSGACPSIVLVQLGEGRLYGLLTLAGILCGTYVGGVLQRRAKLPAEGC
jgi:uncharacterized protein